MKRQRISEVFSYLDEGLVEEAAESRKGERQVSWVKWAAAAACLVLALGVGLSARIPGQDSWQKTTVDTAWMLQYENAYYEIVEDNPAALRKFGVATEVKADLAGRHIAYVKPSVPGNERNDLVVCQEQTDMELLEYGPAKNRAHLVLRKGEEYYIARFCNYFVGDSESRPVRDALEIYGIFGAEDIRSIAPTSWDNTWELTGDAVTDRQAVEAFYTQVLALEPFSEDDHHAMVFAEELKAFENPETGDVGEEVYRRYAEDLHVIVVETVEGIRFAVRCYPSYGWIYFPQTQTHCRISSGMEAWLQTYLP